MYSAYFSATPPLLEGFSEPPYRKLYEPLWVFARGASIAHGMNGNETNISYSTMLSQKKTSLPGRTSYDVPVAVHLH